MTRVMVRRRSEPVEAVQWHKPGDHPAVRLAGEWKVEGASYVWFKLGLHTVAPGDWVVPDSNEQLHRVLTPEQFEQEYERVE